MKALMEFFNRVTKQPKTVRKFFVSLIGALVAAVSQGLLPESVGKWLGIVIIFLTALGIYGVPNAPDESVKEVGADTV